MYYYVLLGLLTCLIITPLHPFLLLAAKEALSHGITPTITFTTHAAQGPSLTHYRPISLSF
jgi:hypothetical protein